MREVFQEARTQLSGGHRAVVATVVRTKGSTPQKPGAKLLIREDGSGVGTLGGGCVEGDIWFAAKELLSRGGPAQCREYQLNEDLAADKVGRGRRQEDNGTLEVVYLAPATSRDALQNGLVTRGVILQRFGDIGANIAGRDSVDLHAAARPFIRQRFC